MARFHFDGVKCAACGKSLTHHALERGWVETKVGLLIVCGDCISSVVIIDRVHGVDVQTMSVEQRLARLERRVL